MALFKFVRSFFTSEYEVVARLYIVPPNKQPVFQTFTIRETSLYDAARHFDQNFPTWTRLSVTKKS